MLDIFYIHIICEVVIMLLIVYLIYSKLSTINSKIEDNGTGDLILDSNVATNEYSLPDNWSRSSNGRGWIIGTEETSAWEDWLLSQVSDFYFDIPDWSGGNYAFTDDEQYNICSSCAEYSECFAFNGCTDGSLDFLVTPSITIPSFSELFFK